MNSITFPIKLLWLDKKTWVNIRNRDIFAFNSSSRNRVEQVACLIDAHENLLQPRLKADLVIEHDSLYGKLNDAFSRNNSEWGDWEWEAIDAAEKLSAAIDCYQPENILPTFPIRVLLDDTTVCRIKSAVEFSIEFELPDVEQFYVLDGDAKLYKPIPKSDRAIQTSEKMKSRKWGVVETATILEDWRWVELLGEERDAILGRYEGLDDV